MVKLGDHRGLGHQVLALMLIVASTPFILLTTIQLSSAKKITEYLPFKRVEGYSESTVMIPIFTKKRKFENRPSKFLFLVEIRYL
jgi:hypothetical protein